MVTVMAITSPDGMIQALRGFEVAGAGFTTGLKKRHRLLAFWALLPMTVVTSGSGDRSSCALLPGWSMGYTPLVWISRAYRRERVFFVFVAPSAYSQTACTTLGDSLISLA